MADNSKDVNSRVQKVLDTDGELPSEEYISIANALKKKKKEYLKGSKTDKAVLKRQLNVWAQNVSAYKNFRQDLAAGYNTKAIMNTWPDSDNGKIMLDMLGDMPRLVEKKCPGDIHCAHKDELGVMVPNPKKVKEAQDILNKLDQEFNNASTNVKASFQEDYDLERNKLLDMISSEAAVWTAISNLKSKIKLKDKGTRDALMNMGNNYISQSSKTNPADNISFPRLAAERQVESNIIGKAQNFESLIYDEMVSGRTFYEDFKRKVSANTYQSLGLQLDGVNPDDGINEEEATKITDAIVNDPKNRDVLKNEMKDYFVTFLYKQWQAGIANRPNPTKENKKPNKYKPGSITGRK